MDPIAQALVNQYYLDSTHINDTVTHTKPGITGATCQGTWLTVERLRSENRDSIVQVQRLVDSSALESNVQVSQPSVMRAVKRLLCYREYPEIDNRSMIARGIFCMAKANVSDFNSAICPLLPN